MHERWIYMIYICAQQRKRFLVVGSRQGGKEAAIRGMSKRSRGTQLIRCLSSAALRRCPPSRYPDLEYIMVTSRIYPALTHGWLGKETEEHQCLMVFTNNTRLLLNGEMRNRKWI